MPLGPLILIGQGSEWLWSLAQFVVVSVSLVAIYRQVRAQSAANAFARIETLQRRWTAPEMHHLRLRAAMRLRHDPAPTLDAAMSEIANFLEDVAILQREGHLTLREVDDTWGVMCQLWWALLAPLIAREREVDGDPRLFAGFESLARQLRENDVRLVGHALHLEPDRLPGWLDELIERARAALELHLDVVSNRLPTTPAGAEAAEAAEG